MDGSRRASRMVIDPKIRQVGFVTNNSGVEVPPTSTSAEYVEVETAGASSLSPVMIPPPRSTLPVPVPAPALPSEAASTMTMGVGVGTSSECSSPTQDDERGYNSIPSQDNLSIDHAWAKPNPNPNPRADVTMVAFSMPSDLPPPPPQHFSHSGSLPHNASMNPPPKQGGGDKGKAPAIEDGDHVTKKLKERTSKAERRAIQEAQRAAKAAAKEAASAGGIKIGDGGAGVPVKEAKGAKLKAQKKDSNAEKKPATSSDKKSTERITEKEKKKDMPSLRMQFDDEQRVAKAKRRSLLEQTETKHRVELFRHLPQYVHGTQLPALEAKFFQDDPMHPHPSVYKVGLQFLTGNIVGGNARCFAMLSAFVDAIRDYKTPPEKTFTRDLTTKINSYISFLITCRPLSISMGNAIKFLKARLAKLSVTLSETEAKDSLILDIRKFIQEKIILADNVIVKHAVSKIRDGDILLTYGFSCVVEMILLHAHESGRKFSVVVVDSRPKLEGLKMLRRLLAVGIKCTYTHINAISFVMHEVTKVLLGAASVLSNGTVYSRVGTACVAMVAHASDVPVLVCCEAYKFHERVQLDSICSNELGDPDALVKVPGKSNANELEGWTDNEHLQLLNLTYDATPSDYVSMIITDYGMVPPTSVPVIVREYRREYLLI